MPLNGLSGSCVTSFGSGRSPDHVPRVPEDGRVPVKQVLIVAYYFAPVAASGAMRPLGFCRNLPTWNWQPRVLTTTPVCVHPTHPVDAKLGQRVPPAIEVVRVPYTDRLQKLLQMRDWLRTYLRKRSVTKGRERPSMNEQTAHSVTPADRPRGNVKDLLLDWAFAFPDRQCGWLRPAVREFLKTGNIPDVIFATGGPWTNFLIGATLAKHFNRPLVLDYRDPWNCNPYYSFNSPLLSQKSRLLEAQVCRVASHVTVNTEELRDRLIADYEGLRDRCTWISNGFDRDLFIQEDREDVVPDGLFTSGGYELCHFGTVYGKRTPRVLFQALWEMFQDGQLKPDAIRLRFVGGWDATDRECERYAVNLEQQGFLRRQPPISHDQCLRQMKRSSVLLVLQPDSPLQVPAKIYEYVATGRPLMLIGGEGATANLVSRHALGLSSPNQLAPIKLLLNDLATGKQKFTPPDPARVNRFEYGSLTGQLVTVLNAVAENPRCP